MRSDRVDGFTIDRGFQVLNTAYPELQRIGLPAGLDLARVPPRRAAARREPGCTSSPIRGRRRAAPPGCSMHRSAAPRTGRRSPPTSREVVLLPGAGLAARSGRRAAETLRRRGVTGAPVEHFLRPFLQGVLLERELTTSSRFAAFVLRTFALGAVGVPAAGMGALPAALAARLPAGHDRVRARVDGGAPRRGRRGGRRDPPGGRGRRRCGPGRGGRAAGAPPPAMHGVTTFWHAVPAPPTRRPVIALDTEGGPVANSVVMTNAAGNYSPDRRALIASSVLGAEPVPDALLRTTLARLWGVGTAGWEEVAVTGCPEALPALPGGSPLRRPVRLAEGLYVAGDHRDTPSIQGALVSGRRAADAYLAWPAERARQQDSAPTAGPGRRSCPADAPAEALGLSRRRR